MQWNKCVLRSRNRKSALILFQGWQHTGRGSPNPGSSRKPSQPLGTSTGVLRILDKGDFNHGNSGGSSQMQPQRRASQTRWSEAGLCQEPPQGLRLVSHKYTSCLPKSYSVSTHGEVPACWHRTYILHLMCVDMCMNMQI